MRMIGAKTVRGFTLFEIMISLVVMALLVAAAYPAYTNQVIESRRAEGKALLMQAASRQQRYFTEHNRYTNSFGGEGLEMSRWSENDYYRLRVVSATSDGFLLRAVRKNAQTADSACGNLTIDHLGVQGVHQADKSAEYCW